MQVSCRTLNELKMDSTCTMTTSVVDPQTGEMQCPCRPPPACFWPFFFGTSRGQEGGYHLGGLGLSLGGASHLWGFCYGVYHLFLGVAPEGKGYTAI